jgi:hypothetical protein
MPAIDSILDTGNLVVKRIYNTRLVLLFTHIHSRAKCYLADARYLGQVATVVSWGQEPNSTTEGTANTTVAGNATTANTTTTPAPGRRRRAISSGKTSVPKQTS